MDTNFHYFAPGEHAVYKKIRKLRDFLVHFLVKIFTLLKITPNMVTLASFLCILFFVYFCVRNPLVALFFLGFHMILDGIDGPFARLTNRANSAGAFLDMLNDHTGLVIVMGSLVFYSLLNLVIGLIYIYLYSLLVIFLVLRNMLGIHPAFTLRTKHVPYLTYVLWAVTAINIFDKIMIVCIIITLIPLTESLRALLRFLKDTK